jgi:hypothetical protein
VIVSQVPFTKAVCMEVCSASSISLVPPSGWERAAYMLHIDRNRCTDLLGAALCVLAMGEAVLCLTLARVSIHVSSSTRLTAL